MSIPGTPSAHNMMSALERAKEKICRAAATNPDAGAPARADALCALLTQRIPLIARMASDNPNHTGNLVREALAGAAMSLVNEGKEGPQLNAEIAGTRDAFATWMSEAGLDTDGIPDVEGIITQARRDKAQLNPLPAAKPNPRAFPNTPKNLATDVIDALGHCPEKIALVFSASKKNLPTDTLSHDIPMIGTNLSNLVIRLLKDGVATTDDLAKKMAATLTKRITGANEGGHESLRRYRAEMLVAFEIFAEELGIKSQMREAVKSVPTIGGQGTQKTP